MVKTLEELDALFATLTKSKIVLRRWLGKPELRKPLDQCLAMLYLDSHAIAEVEGISMPAIDLRALGPNVPSDVIQFWTTHFGKSVRAFLSFLLI